MGRRLVKVSGLRDEGDLHKETASYYKHSFDKLYGLIKEKRIMCEKLMTSSPNSKAYKFLSHEMHNLEELEVLIHEVIENAPEWE